MQKRSTSESFELFFSTKFPLFFLAGALLLAILGNVASNLLSLYFIDVPNVTNAYKIHHLWWVFVLVLLILASLVALAYGIGAIRSRRTQKLAQSPQLKNESPFNTPRKGVILTLSLTSAVPDSVANYVFKSYSPRPQWVGFLGTKETEAEGIHLQLQKTFGLSDEQVKNVAWEPTDVSAGKEKTLSVINWMLAKDLTSRDIVLDLTGGKVTTSIAAFMAVQELQIDSQYVDSTYKDRLLVKGSQAPLLITSYTNKNAEPEQG